MTEWLPICAYERLEPERGVAVLLPGPTQVAVFRAYDGALYAIDNIDPMSKAAVLSRGIVGTRGEIPILASPMHKHAYDLRTGACLDQPGISVRSYPVRCRDGVVEVAWAT